MSGLRWWTATAPIAEVLWLSKTGWNVVPWLTVFHSPPEALATKLARETVAGSGELLHQSELASGTLRQNVTSPGGTTAAALGVLMGEPGLRDLMIRAIAAATQRSKELAK